MEFILSHGDNLNAFQDFDGINEIELAHVPLEPGKSFEEYLQTFTN